MRHLRADAAFALARPRATSFFYAPSCDSLELCFTSPLHFPHYLEQLDTDYSSSNAIAMASACSRQLVRAHPRPRFNSPSLCHARITAPSRSFSSSRTAFDQQNFHRKESFRSRLNAALKNTKIKWEPIPIALGIGFLGAFQLYRIQRREKHTDAGANKDLPDEVSVDSQGRPKKRERIRPSGPWLVNASPSHQIVY